MKNVSLPMKPSDYIKEGLWTVEEDRRLLDYIQSYGVTSWLRLPDIAGLLRSGTSCRLRWLNHLNPPAERGNLTEEEQHLVIRSCWDIASSVPGKTDDDIRNFWTNYKKSEVVYSVKNHMHKISIIRLWAVEEDRRLLDYIQSHDVSSLLNLPYIAGLLRSGMSCDFRWLNHPNPPAERGDLTEEEQHLVIRSCWDTASSVPGKTDDVRNFWTNYKNSEVVHSVKNSLENVRLPRISSDYIKEGLWTVEEDRRLSDYIQSHGVSSWLSLPDMAGLLRSGMSCRLRWLNHRIPAAERGDLTEEEQHLVIRLLAQFGASDSDIALLVPGKTNDDIRNFCTNYSDSEFVQKTKKVLEYIAQMLNDEDETQNERDATRIEQNNTNVGQPNSITIPPTLQDDLHSENKAVVQVDSSENNDTTPIYGPDQDLRDAQILNNDDETQNERDATCIEQNDTNVGQLNSITIQPTPQDDLHSENKGVIQVDSSENNDTTPNDSDFDDDDQNNNKTSLDTTHISKTPGYITSKICFSLEVLKQHFDKNMEDAAKSLNVSRSSLKRMCRENGIERWPCRKRRKINHQQRADPKNVNKLVQKNNYQMNQSTRTQAEIISPSGNASSTNNNVIIKATYGDDIIKFRLSVSSGVDELREKISKRLELEVRSFKLKYRDDAGDLVLITCDEDLHDCLGNSRLSTSIDHKTTFDILVFPVTN